MNNFNQVSTIHKQSNIHKSEKSNHQTPVSEQEISINESDYDTSLYP